MFDEVFKEDISDNEFSTIAIDNQCYFDDAIIERGEDYYRDDKVENVTKMGNVFVADVCGNECYTVRVVVDEDELLMSCNCPYDDNCKHEYATLLAIQDGKYSVEELKPFVDTHMIEFEDLIKKIPAEALKKYILSDSGLENVSFNMEDLERTFTEYVPKQEYDFYYNNLYNSFLLRDEPFELYDSYYDEIRKYIDSYDYIQAFNIIKSIIEVSHDLDVDIVSYLPELGMYFRISYRKASKEDKKIMEKYIMSLILNQYYNNLYLEDMINHLN